MKASFKALVVEEDTDGHFTQSIKKRSLHSLPENEVLIKVYYSALNYKDALSATGNKSVTREYPHTPGIDASGMVVKSDDQRFSPGEKVLVTGYDLGMNTSGGFGEYICVPADWIVPLPKGLSLKESMIIGTAGFTAAFGIYKIGHNITGSPKDKTALVTGATGGVGSLAISILYRNGFKVIAATGKSDEQSYLKKLGASEVIDRNDIYQSSRKPLLSRRWDVALDTVGGKMLDAVLRQTAQNGTVACCGNILGRELKTNIYPFILRGVNLMGMNSATCPQNTRQELWKLLANGWKPESLEPIYHTCTLDELNREINKIIESKQVGKVLLVHKQ